MSRPQGVSPGASADYVVIGAGSAGSVITRRLLDSGATVHVVEVGSTDEDPNIHSPQGWPMMFGTANDWSVMTVPQVHAKGRSLYWPRGKVLGGSSSLNGMIYMRGHRSDHDEWAYHGCAGWDWDSVLPLLKRSEDFNGETMVGAGFNHTTTRDGRRMSAW